MESSAAATGPAPTVPLVRPGTARALRRAMGPLADESLRPVSANTFRQPAKPARMPALGLDSLIAYQAAMIQRPVVAPVAVSSKLKPFATRDLLASQSVRVSSSARSGSVNPIVGGIAQSLVEWQQRARQGLQESIAAAEAEEAAAAAVEDVGDDDGLDWSRFDAAAGGSRVRPLSAAAAGGRRGRSPSAGRGRGSPVGRAGGGAPLGAAASTPALLPRPPSAYDRYLLRRRQEVVEVQNAADIARALDQWRENKTAVDAEIERRIQARRRPQSGAWAGLDGGGAAMTLHPPTPRARGAAGGGGEGDDEDVLLLRGAPTRHGSPPQHESRAQSRLGTVAEEGSPGESASGGRGGGSPLREAPTLPFAATRASAAVAARSTTAPFAVTAGSRGGAGGGALDGGSSLSSRRPSMMHWWGAQVRAQSAMRASASHGSLGLSGGGGDGAEDGRPWSAWATTRAVLPPRSSGAAAAAAGGVTAAAAGGDAGLAPPAASSSGVRPVSSGRLQALMSATQRPRTAADIGELAVGTSGVDVLSNAAAIRYYVYDDARREFERVQGLWGGGGNNGTDGGALSPGGFGEGGGEEGEEGGRRQSLVALSHPLLQPSLSLEAAARVYMPSLACVSLDAAKQQLDAIPQTRVAPFAGAGAAGPAQPSGKPGAAAKAPAKAAAARPGSAGATAARKPGVPSYSVTVGPRQWSAGGAAPTFAFPENPLLLEKRLQALRDDALGIGKKKKGGGAKKKK